MIRYWYLQRQRLVASIQQSPSNVAIVLSLVGIALLSAMDALAKWILEDSLHVIQLLFVRGLIITVFLLVTFGASGKLHRLKPTQIKAQILRGTFGFIAPFGFFLSLKYLPLTNTNVVFFSGIFFITIMSSILLKEKVGPYRWGAVIIGYIGVFIAIDPSGDGELLGYVLALISSAAYAAIFVSGKILSKTESSESLVLFYNLGVGAVAAIWLPQVWQSMDMQDWLNIIGFSALAVVGQYCMTLSYSMANASLIAPLDYTAIVWAVLFDILIWQSIPTMQTIVGGFIIISSSAFVIWRQHVNQQRNIA